MATLSSLLNSTYSLAYPAAGIVVSNGSAWSTSLTAPTSLIVGINDTQTLTNKTIAAGSNTISGLVNANLSGTAGITNANLANSSVTVNGSAISLGGSATVTAVNPSALTIGTGLSGSSYNGSGAVTIAIDSTVTTLTGSQTLTNKTLTSPTITGGTIDGVSIGYRNIPWSGAADKVTSYTLSTGDIGDFVSLGTGGAITVPATTFSAGDVIMLYNNTTGNITITCSAVTTYIGGTNTTKSTVTLATRGICNIFFYSASVCVITGNVL